MKRDYKDITDRISESPKWFDENGVPRYCDFYPDEVANIYAQEVLFLHIGCQNCYRIFDVTLSFDFKRKLENFKEDFSYGDPPNIGCCVTGPSMTSENIKLLEYWNRNEFSEWERNNSMEFKINMNIFSRRGNW